MPIIPATQEDKSGESVRNSKKYTPRYHIINVLNTKIKRREKEREREREREREKERERKIVFKESRKVGGFLLPLIK
jgi:hypothetical protein